MIERPANQSGEKVNTFLQFDGCVIQFNLINLTKVYGSRVVRTTLLFVVD